VVVRLVRRSGRLAPLKMADLKVTIGKRPRTLAGNVK